MNQPVADYMDALDAAIAHESLYEFVRQGWPILEPETEFVDNWHIRVICDHLEAAYRGEIKRLVVNIPPRCMKSLLVSVFYPAWVWAKSPGHQFLCVSHGEDLATRDNLKMRQLITSDWYRRHWPHVQLAPDQNKKTEFQNTARGHRIAAGIGGNVTGYGCHTLLIDDPHNADASRSDAARLRGIHAYRESLYSRLNDRATGVIIIIMQRLHEADLSGIVLGEVESEPAVEEWDHLMIPMEYDPDREKPSKLGYYDNRTTAGELLWPDKFDAGEVSKLRQTLGAYGASGQLDQSPAPPEGGMFKRDWFREYTEKVVNGKLLLVTDDGYEIEADKLFKFGAGDLAFTKEKRSDYTVLGAAAGDKSTGYLFVYEWNRTKIDLLERVNEDGAHEDEIRKFNRNTGINWIAVEKAFLSSRVIKNLQSKNEAVRPIDADKDKDLRFYGVEDFLSSRRLFVKKGAPWVSALVRECTKYPNAGHDDQFDVIVYLALLWKRIGVDSGNKIGRIKAKGAY